MACPGVHTSFTVEHTRPALTCLAYYCIPAIPCTTYQYQPSLHHTTPHHSFWTKKKTGFFTSLFARSFLPVCMQRDK